MVSALPKAFPFLFLEPISPLQLLCMLFLVDRLWDVFSSDIYTWPVEVLHSRADSEINDGQSGVLEIYASVASFCQTKQKERK